MAFYQKWARTICLGAICMMPVLLVVAKKVLDSNRNNVVDWLPSNFPETTKLFWFIERFGSDEILGVSWDGCTLDDPRLDRFAARMVEPVALPGEDQAKIRFRHVFTGRDTLRQLTERPLQLPREEALRRMNGWLVGADGRATCAVALIAPAGEEDRQAAVDCVYHVAESCGIPPSTLRLGGPTADSVSIDRASQQGVAEMAMATAVLSMAVAFVCLRRIRLVLILFLNSTFAWAVSLSLVWVTGQHMDAVLLMMPALVFVLAISGVVHLTNYYLEVAPTCRPEEVPFRTVQQGWLPCVLAAVTTALGLLSLAVSKLTPVRRFGILAALGTLVTSASLFTLWVSAHQAWPLRSLPSRVNSAGAALRRPWWSFVFRLATGRWALVLAVFLAGTVPCLYGIFKLRTSAQLQDLLPENSTPMQHYLWLQEHIGPLVPVEIVLKIPVTPDERADARAELARAELVEALRRHMADLPDVGATIAATTFAPSLPERGGARQVAQRRVIAARLARHREQLKQLHFLYDEPDAELWRISARVPSIGVDFGKFLATFNKHVDAFLAATHREGQPDVSAVVCGGVPLIFMAQEQLLRDLGESFLTAFVMIGLCLVAQVRSLPAGLIAMLPNVFPCVVAFGALGLARVPVDIGTMMTASVGMGIAVDDTLHLLSWFQRGLAELADRKAAIRFAFRHAATAMLQTTCIVSIGLLVFVISPFKPIARFGGVMSATLLVALLGDLVMLPALLASPLGRFFKPIRFVSEVPAPGECEAVS